MLFVMIYNDCSSPYLMLMHRLPFLHAGRLTAKRFKNSSSEKRMEKWFFAAETATYPSFIFFLTSHMGMEKEILLVSWGYVPLIKSMNALTCRRCSSFSDATYSETETAPISYLQLPTGTAAGPIPFSGWHTAPGFHIGACRRDCSRKR